MDRKFVFVVGGTHHQSENWAKNEKLSRMDWTHVNDLHKLYGAFDGEVIFVGTYIERNDIFEIMDYVIFLKRLKRVEDYKPTINADTE